MDNNNFSQNNGYGTNGFGTPTGAPVPPVKNNAHAKGIISTILGIASILLAIIGLVSFCSCACVGGASLPVGATSAVLDEFGRSVYNGLIATDVILALALVASITGLVLAASTKRTSNDSLVTAGLVLSIIGIIISAIFLIIAMGVTSCGCMNGACNTPSSYYGY